MQYIVAFIVQIPDYLSPELIITILQETLNLTTLSINKTLQDLCDEENVPLSEYKKILASKPEVEFKLNDNLYKLIQIGEVEIFKKYNITSIQLQSGLLKYQDNIGFLRKCSEIMNRQKKLYF